MRTLLVLACIAACNALAADPAPPKTYGLVAAFSDRFNFVYEPPPSYRVASARVDAYRRETVEAPQGTFNKIALVGLAEALAAKEPDAKQVLLSVSGHVPSKVGVRDHQDYLLARVVKALRDMPERNKWHRVLVALPAYRVLKKDDMPTRLEGFGVVLQPNCSSNPKYCAMAFTPPDGADVKTPTGEDIQANFFIAPYSNIAVITLDPVSLTVIDRQEAFEHQKMFDPQSGTMDLSVNIAKDILAKEVVNQIGRSVHTALDAPDPRGKADIKGIREIKAEDVKR
ncbi:hypothetical protein [Usitatibacter palustris]|uniref:Uncharacterized protein n=1 Tax=Usitatibacter palustris TaxID=2732487 RepID=A0A6M4H2Z4_9PROT|nr:hypothetical protein [Usitatibacter palustris]QJR13951.1 hypothetical protein DSM104440_00743 [Usitatibacter palustris]